MEASVNCAGECKGCRHTRITSYNRQYTQIICLRFLFSKSMYMMVVSAAVVDYSKGKVAFGLFVSKSISKKYYNQTNEILRICLYILHIEKRKLGDTIYKKALNEMNFNSLLRVSRVEVSTTFIFINCNVNEYSNL